ncbi:PREDICTED: anthocyanidin 3-O-glucosyltransferase 6 [Theobroma cacao]|uniref:Glycosyltransferase n=1 Tax=Theobroma cacao TaxID=3641 RepID=A0AB32WZG4_THECC|nr:PREDICTED: anthocyanidin 3-O-glucosyltransferase 6 [Theobroma cacao]
MSRPYQLSVQTMKKAELVFVPMPGIGHLVSTVGVAKLLVDLNSNLFVTVLIIKPPYDPNLTAYVDSLIADTDSISTHIKFINLPQDKTQQGIPLNKFITTIIQSQGPHIKEAVAKIVHFSSSVPDSPRLAGFVLDFFLTALVDLANEFGVASYVFYTSSAASLGFQFYMQALHDEQNVDIVKLKGSDAEFTIPSYFNPISAKFFPTIMFKPETSTIMHNVSRELRKVKGIMVNTFSELESHAVNSLTDGKYPAVYPVGPILNLKGASGVHQNSYIMKWLDEQPLSSVVFLCFGSMGSFGGDQAEEIARALEQSGHRFLWSLRQPSVEGMMLSPTDYENVAEVLPEGFLERTATIGKIIGWAPQVAILGHPAIGGFVSHCGWNSTLESIWFGVPMATWPLYAEQQLNAFQMVMELGLGVEITWTYETMEIVSAENIERGIRCLMEQDSDVRNRAKEMSKQSRKALMEGGSSHSMLCRFINDVIDNMP